MDTDHPAIVQHDFGRGRSVYMSGQVFRAYNEYGHSYFRTILQDILRNAVPRPTVCTNAPGGVEVSAFEHPDGMAIDLVNYSGRQGRPFSDIVPVRDIQLRVVPPTKLRRPGARALRQGRDLAVTVDGDSLVCKLEELVLQETVVLFRDAEGKART
jgi:hypothetical protein